MLYCQVDDTELTNDGVNYITFYVPPEETDKFYAMMDAYPLHVLEEPVLVDIDIDQNGAPIKPSDKINPCYFIQTKVEDDQM